MARVARVLTRLVLILSVTGLASCENLATGPTLADVALSPLGKEPTTEQ
jgi:hypothetical protein